MIKEFGAFLTLFKQGKALANSAAWKNQQLFVSAFTGAAGAAVVIAQGFGYDTQISEQTLGALAGGIFAALGVYHAVITAITSAKVGLPAGGEPDVEGDPAEWDSHRSTGARDRRRTDTNLHEVKK